MSSVCRPLFTLVLLTTVSTQPLAAATLCIPAEYSTITSALSAATPGDTVLIACGTYQEHDLYIDKGITLRSESGTADCVTIDAGGMGRVAHLDGFATPRLLIEGITLTGGLANNGGGLSSFGAAFTLRNCVVIDNEATSSGGGLYLYYSDFELDDCEFMGNSAKQGGGLFSVYNFGSMTLTDCLFAFNQAVRGGGYFIDDDDAFIDGSIFHANQAQLGGALFVSYSHPTITSCTIAENTASTGSGLCLENGSLIVESSILAYGLQGQAVHSDGYNTFVQLQTCDLFGNEGGDWVGPIADQLDVDCNISLDPQFCGVFGSGDFTLQSDSPCTVGGNDCDVLIGAHPVGCGDLATAPNSWSRVKSLY